MNTIFNRWSLLLLVLLSIGAAVFWRDAMEHSADSVSSVLSSGETPTVLADEALATVAGAYLDGTYDSNSPGALANLDIVPRGDGAYAVSTRLDGVTAHGFYPNLFVTMNAIDGKPVRTIVVTPQHYQHAAQVVDGPILVAVATRSGEQRIRVRASFGEPRPIR